jgi:hypothetical protein
MTVDGPLMPLMPLQQQLPHDEPKNENQTTRRPVDLNPFIPLPTTNTCAPYHFDRYKSVATDPAHLHQRLAPVRQREGGRGGGGQESAPFVLNKHGM